MTVTELNRALRSLVEVEFSRVAVEGEVSNLRRQQSGHCYFTLKDANAQLSCVIFRGQAARLGGSLKRLQDGQALTCHGELTVYEQRGNLQLVVQRIEMAGAGVLQARFEALKNKLASEGLFDASRKTPLPRMPRHIGLITSPTGAALQDFLQVITRRAPWLTIYLAAVPVQGQDAAPKLRQALRSLVRQSGKEIPALDLIVLTRGGGSLEDLWAFNEEELAREIARCPLPIVSAVGHEIDHTIADFVADLRAPTPSIAAELIAPDRAELDKNLADLRRRLRQPLAQRLSHARALLARHERTPLTRILQRRLRQQDLRLDQLRQALGQTPRQRLGALRSSLQLLELRWATLHPRQRLAQRRAALESLHQRLNLLSQSQLRHHRENLRRTQGMLAALSPQAVLQRGYSLTALPDGTLLTHPTQAPPGTRLRTRLAQGEVMSEVSGPAGTDRAAPAAPPADFSPAP